eukprot:g45438.t1
MDRGLANWQKTERGKRGLFQDIRSVFLGVDPRKALDLDGVPGRALRSCADQLAEIFINIFNFSLLQTEVPTCFKEITIIPTTIGEDRKKGGEHPSASTELEVMRVKSIKFLRVTITVDLPWISHINATVKKAQQCLLFLRQLRKFSITNFYRCTIEGILSVCITAWYGNCSAQDRKKLQKVVCT